MFVHYCSKCDRSYLMKEEDSLFSFKTKCPNCNQGNPQVEFYNSRAEQLLYNKIIGEDPQFLHIHDYWGSVFAIFKKDNYGQYVPVKYERSTSKEKEIVDVSADFPGYLKKIKTLRLNSVLLSHKIITAPCHLCAINLERKYTNYSSLSWNIYNQSGTTLSGKIRPYTDELAKNILLELRQDLIWVKYIVSFDHKDLVLFIEEESHKYGLLNIFNPQDMFIVGLLQMAYNYFRITSISEMHQKIFKIKRPQTDVDKIFQIYWHFFGDSHCA